MWAHLALLLLVGTSLANPIWRPNYEYHYAIQSRSLTGTRASDQVSGIIMKTRVKISVPNEDYLIVEFTDRKYTPIQQKMEAEWNAPIFIREQDYIDTPAAPHVMKFRLRDGQIEEAHAPVNMETSLINFIKGLMSQLQLRMDVRMTQNLNNEPYQSFTTREQTVTSYCDTIYNVAPLNESPETSQLTTLFNKHDNEQLYEVTKYRDYQNCVQEANYFYMLTEEPSERIQKDYFRRMATNNLIVSLWQDSLTILSSRMKNIMEVRPKVEDMESLTVYSWMDARLVKLDPIEGNVDERVTFRPVGNLSYVYDPEDTWENEFLFTTTETEEHTNWKDNTESSPEMATLTLPSLDDKVHESSEEDTSTYNNRMHRFIMRKRETTSPGWPHSNVQNRIPTRSVLIETAVSTIQDIATSIQNPDDLVRQHTLERFTILVEVLRHLNTTDITNIQDRMQLTHRWVHQQNNEEKVRLWKVFRDAVVQTGTQNSFNIIRDWIQEKMIVNIEAANVISKLSRVVFQPTPEYIEQLFEFIRTPEVTTQMFLNTTAPFAFSEIVRYGLVLDQRYVYARPNRPNGVSTSERMRVRDIYIPYFAKQLGEAYQRKHNSAIVKNIVVLGNIGHPKVISVFEPYLEGKYHLTTFQRTMMVDSLKRIIPEAQDVVREIVYRIYQNERENYEVRVMAVNVLLKTYPPLHTLQLIAERATTEKDPRVRNVIITGIENLSQLTSPKLARVAKDARIVRKHFKLDKRSETSSSMSFMDYVNRKKDFSAWFDLGTIDADNNVIKLWDMQYGTNSSYLSPPSTRAHFSASDINTLWDTVEKIVYRLSGHGPGSKVDEMAEKLSIINDNSEVPEATVILSDRYETSLYIFDQDTALSLIQNYQNLYMKDNAVFRNTLDLQGISMWNFLLFFPTELGIPVNYRIKKPEVSILKSQTSVKHKQSQIETDLQVDVILNTKTINRIAFTTPFSRDRYFAGADSDLYLRIPPGKIVLKLNDKKKMVGIDYTMEPTLKHIRILHLNNIPYTGRADYVDMRPILTLDNTHSVIIGETKKDVRNVGDMIVTIETDDCVEQTNDGGVSGIFGVIMDTFYTQTFHHKKYQIDILNRKPRNENYDQVLLANNEKKLHDYEDKNDVSMSMLINYDQVLLASDWGKHFGNSSTTEQTDNSEYPYDSHTWNKLGIVFKQPSINRHYQCYAGLSESTDQLLHKFYFDCKEPSNKKWLDVKAELVSSSSGCPTLDVDSDKTRQLTATITYGREGETYKNIHIEGHQKQSELEKQWIKNTALYHRSTRAREHGRTDSKDTENICKVIDHMDEHTLSIKMEPQDLQTLNWLAVKWAKWIPDSNIDLIQTFTPQPDMKIGTWTLKMLKPLDSEIANLTMASQTLFMQMPLQISPLLPQEPIDVFYGITSNWKQCIVGKTTVKTFDNTEYRVKSSKYPRVLMINPTRSKPNLGILSFVSAMPNTYNIAITSQDINDKQRQLLIIYRNKLYKIKPPTDSSSHDILVINNREFNFDENRETTVEQDPIIKITKVSPQTFRIFIEQAEVTILYDYETVQIEISDNYDGNLRGLCGTNTGNTRTDLVAPSGCIMKDPEHFATLYTWINGPLDEDTKILQKQAEEAECKTIGIQEVNFITGTQWNNHLTDDTAKCTTFRTKITTDRVGRVCLSTRPLPVCNPGCTSGERIQKEMNYYCELEGPEIRDLVRKIQQGARPDLSMKSEIFPITTDMPVRCHRTH